MLQHYPRRFIGGSTPGSPQRTEPLVNESTGKGKHLNAITEDSDDDNLFTSDDDEPPPKKAATVAAARPYSPPTDNPKPYAPPAGSAGKGRRDDTAPDKEDSGPSVLFGDQPSEDETSSRPMMGGTRHDASGAASAAHKRRSSETTRDNSPDKQQRRYNNSNSESPGEISPTPRPDESLADSPDFSQEMERSIPPGAAPGSDRKRDSRRDSRRESEPLVRETVPPHSSPVEHASEPDSGGKSEFRKKLQEDHRNKMAQKQAEIEQLHDHKDRMTEELRKLKQASSSAERLEDESKRKDRKLEDAQHDLKTLQREKERLNDDVKEEREKRLGVVKRLETAELALEAERGVSEELRASERRAREQYDSLRREKGNAVGIALDGLQAKLDELRRTSSGSSNGSKCRLVSDGKGRGGGSESFAVPRVAPARPQTRSTQSAAAEFNSVPETQGAGEGTQAVSDSLGMS